MAATLWAVGAVMLAAILARQAADPGGQYGFDFATYHRASAEMLSGRSPYAPEMFRAPVPAQGPGAQVYKYPPVFAEALTPLAVLPLPQAQLAWLLLQTMLVVAGVWLAGSAGGLAATPERLLWSGVAATWYLPIFDTLWKGNVSGLLAFMVGLGALLGLRAGAAAGLAALIKGTTLTLVPMALLAPGSARRGLAIAAGLGIVSLLIAPGAWLDYAAVLPNLVAGSAAFPTNLAPDALVSQHGPDAIRWLAGPIRLVTVALGVGFLLAGCRAARATQLWPLALTCGVAAMLLLPSSIWYHYLALLLPVAALAWSRATAGGRIAMVASGALVSAALAWLPLAVLGAAGMLAASLSSLRPQRLSGE
ncbi:MAG TPA: glycosyltransferase family 87 protein [Candidatus Limnocylindrales bacterium]|nr:glycosyltransferase family 87 protein [Candidatus Limnocylindrales bacterium]